MYQALSIRLNEEQREALDGLAKFYGIEKSKMVRRVIDEIIIMFANKTPAHYPFRLMTMKDVFLLMELEAKASQDVTQKGDFLA